MKAFTDISQSKKLSEILPLESADMCYLSEESLVPKVIYNGMAFFDSKEEKLTNIIYCWGLAALLAILPSGKALIHDKGNLGYKCICNNMDTHFHDNPVDACVAMVIKLHEQKLL